MNLKKYNNMKFKRVLLKLSGETMGGAAGTGLDPQTIRAYSKVIAKAVKSGVEIGVVVGGGNIFRGLKGVQAGFDRVKGDQMGMLATVINGLALQMFLKEEGLKAEVFTSVKMEPFAKYYSKEKAVKVLEKGGVAIFTGGTGNPFFTTDSAASLRGCEIGADVILKGTKVDGVYDKDPAKHPDAVKYETLDFKTAITEDLKVMDQTAFAMCKDNNLPIIVFNMNTPENLSKVLEGEKMGTLVSN